jgi:hypothetical protein
VLMLMPSFMDASSFRSYPPRSVFPAPRDSLAG